MATTAPIAPSSSPDDALTSDRTTWAKRNPGKPTIPSRPGRPAPTNAEKATRALRVQTTQIRKEALTADLQIFEEEQDKKLREIAEKHGRPFEYVSQLLRTSSHYKQKRAPSLHNAIIFDKARELNSDLGVGERYTLREVQELASSDPAYKSLASEQIQALKNALHEHRELKKTGARPSNQSAAQDVRRTAARIGEDILALSERTGSHGFCFITRGHVDDTLDPTWCGSAEAEDFLRQVFDINAWDLARKFEQFACNLTERGKPRDTTATMRAECTKMILKGLRQTTKDQNVAMNYIRYDFAIVEPYHVKLVGWPEGIKMASPSQITTMEDLRRLRDALASDNCKWVHLTASEIKAHDAYMKELRGTPGAVKKRKQRSDVGVKRKQAGDAPAGEDGQDVGGDGEDRPSRKKAKKGGKKGEKAASKAGAAKASASKKGPVGSSKKRLPPFKSREMISDSEDEDEDEDDAESEPRDGEPEA